MKSSIHPQNYRPVVFSDDQAGFAFLTQSTAQTTDLLERLFGYQEAEEQLFDAEVVLSDMSNNQRID